MTHRFTFKGKARPVGPRWEEGFQEAYNLCSIGLSMDCGKYGGDWGSAGKDNINHGGYGNGFAEGSISGRSAYAALVGGYGKEIISR